MDPKIVIRDETNSDVDAITEVPVAAFKTLEISNNTEQFIVMALRAAEALRFVVERYTRNQQRAIEGHPIWSRRD